MSCDCDASFLLDAPAPWAAAISCVETAAVCLAATSRRRISFFLRALDAAALQAALGDEEEKGTFMCILSLTDVYQNNTSTENAYRTVHVQLTNHLVHTQSHHIAIS